MSKALRYGLMAGAQGFLQGMLFNWQQMQKEAQTERLRAARRLEQEELERIKLNIAPPQRSQSVQIGDDGKQYMTESEWRVNTEGPMTEWKGESVEVGRQEVPRKLSYQRFINDGKIEEWQLDENGNRIAKVSEGDRHKPPGQQSSTRPQAFVPKGGSEGKPMWLTPGVDEIPDGYVPANSSLANPSQGGTSTAAIRKEVAAEVQELTDSDLRETLNQYGIEAGPGRTIKDARRDLINFLVSERTGGSPAAEQPSAPMPSTENAPNPGQPLSNGRVRREDVDKALAIANDAIKRGADPEKIKAELRKLGIEVK